MHLHILPDGRAYALYGEQIDLAALGALTITRASHVEPTATGTWIVDLGPVAGPRLGPFSQRTRAIEAEERWLNRHHLPRLAAPSASPIFPVPRNPPSGSVGSHPSCSRSVSMTRSQLPQFVLHVARRSGHSLRTGLRYGGRLLRHAGHRLGLTLAHRLRPRV